MAETKINFIKSKMNKDLDDRLLGNGEYREGVNIAVNKSEDSDVGALENILGNFSIASIGSQNQNLSIIGRYMDYTNDRIILFLTDYTDSSSNGLDNFSSLGSENIIASYNINNNVTSTLVTGRFLNFSKNSPMYGLNMIEDLLFWTDNRNQPRKINVTKAISDSTYYSNEDHISVAKYFPYKPLRLYNISEVTCNSISTVEEFSVRFTFTTTGLNIKKGDYLTDVPGQTRKLQIVDVFPSYILVNYGTRSQQPKWDSNSLPGRFDFKIISAAGKDKASEHLPVGLILSSMGGNTSTGKLMTGDAQIRFNSQTVRGGVPSLCVDINNSTAPTDGAYPSMGVKPGMRLSIPGNNQKLIIDTVVESQNSSGNYAYFNFSPAYEGPSIWYPSVGVHSQNPNYEASWPGDKNFLEDKFVRFSYRFKFDDGEYSLIAPFSQPVFIPKQMGWLTDIEQNEAASWNDDPTADNQWQRSPSWYPAEINGNATSDPYGQDNIDRQGGSGEIVSQLRTAAKNTVVDWFENKVNNIEINIPTEYKVNEMANKLKIKSFEILYKESDGISIKSIDEISTTDVSVINNATNTYTYTYQSRKPIKLLPESETTRVYDKVPVRAKAQEVAGNRIIYGNFLDQHTPPPSLDFQVNASDKFPEYDKYSTEYSQVSYPLHSLKQDRNYEVGIVLSDRYGRQSSVIPANVNLQEFTQDGLTFGGSSIYHPYKPGVLPTTANQIASLTNSIYPYADIKDWWGDSLKLAFINQIPTNISSNAGYPGLYTELITEAAYRSNLQAVYSIGSLGVVDPNIKVGNTAQIYNVNGEIVDLIVENIEWDGSSTSYTTITLDSLISVNPPITSSFDVTTGSKLITFATGTDMSKFNVGMILRNFAGAFDPIVVEKYASSLQLKVTTIGSATTGNVSANFTNDFKFFSPDQKLGWYSYKVVVKQNQQEYYNVYLPNLVNGEPYIIESGNITGQLNTYTNQNTTATVSLLTDNVNKIPPDLLDIVPNQQQFRSSDSLLTPRISPIQRTNASGNSFTETKPLMIFPKEEKEDVLTIGQYESLYGNNVGIGGVVIGGVATEGVIPLWKGETNPPTLKITNKFQIGNSAARNPNFKGNTSVSFLSTVLETEPVVSNIDIYYETSTSGLVSELNEAVRQSQLENTVSQFSFSGNVLWNERTTPIIDQNYGGNDYIALSGSFYFQNSAGQNLTNVIPTVTGISRGSQPFNSSQFKLLPGGLAGQYVLYGRGVTWNSGGTTTPGVFVEDDINNPWTIDTSVFNNGITSNLQLTARKQNVAPTVKSQIDLKILNDPNTGAAAWNIDNSSSTDPNGTRAWNYWQPVTNSGWGYASGVAPVGTVEPVYYVYGSWNSTGTLWQAPQVGYPANGNSYSDTGLPFVMSKNGAGVDPPDVNVPYIMSGFIREDKLEWQFQPIVGNGAPVRDVEEFAATATFQPMTQPNPPYLNRDYAQGGVPSDTGSMLGPLDELVLSYDPIIPHWKMDSNGKFQPQFTSNGATPDLDVALYRVGYATAAGKLGPRQSPTIAISTPASGFWGNEYWLNLILTDANSQGLSTRLRIHVILLANTYGGTKPG